ncbi:pyrroline-5-carboxylate reductase, partial [Klebsiella variicola]
MAKVQFMGDEQMSTAIIPESLCNDARRADAISQNVIDSARIGALHYRYRLAGDGDLR